MIPIQDLPPRIEILPPEVIERIAAGEIIERPASVVRELIANALDANATDVRVETREGGLRLIRVSDDGWGIAPDDLELATRPHTTSKAHNLDDLERLTTLGFRGEALASVAAVAELTLVSASDTQGLAEVITLRGGATIARERAPRGRGTTVTARDLFHAMPARRALLRGPRAEAARVAAITRAYALAHPAVRFTLIDDGALLLQTPGTDLAGAVAAIFGADVARALLPLTWFDGALPDATASGIVTARPLNFPTREHVYVSVNGRPLANRPLLSALETGYRPALRKGRHPLLVVRLSVAPERIDANIHPAKLDALLRDEAAIAAALRKLTHETLGATPTELTSAGAPATALSTSSLAPLRMTFPTTRRRRGLRLREQPQNYSANLAALQWDDAPATTLPSLTPLAQFDNTLIVAQSQDGHLYLVDQHRAHERVLYERLLAQRRASTHESESSATAGQLLLEPLLIELTPLQARTLTARMAELAELGLELQPFGGSSFLARALPIAPGAAQSAVGFAEELARDAAEEGDDWLDHVCRSLACRSAIRRGQPLSEPEQRALLDDLRQTTAPAVCPHGSPLIIRHSRTALTKLFEW